jgi:hypothetical protein
MPCPDCDYIETKYCEALDRLAAFDENCIRSTTTEEGESIQWNATRTGLMNVVNSLWKQVSECRERASAMNELFMFSSRGVVKQCNRPLNHLPQCCDEGACEGEP